MTFRVQLSAEERVELDGWQRMTTTPTGRVRRARAILLLADGYPLKDVVVRGGMTPTIVRKWARRFIAQRLDGLADRPRPGRKPLFSP